MCQQIEDISELKSLHSSRGSNTDALRPEYDSAGFYRTPSHSSVQGSELTVRILRCKSESEYWSAKYPSKLTILKSIGRVLRKTRGESGCDGSESPIDISGASFPEQSSVDEIKRKWRCQQIAARDKVMKEQRGTWFSRLILRRGAFHVLHQQSRQ